MVTPVVPFVTSTGVCECEELIVPQGVVVVVAQRTKHADKQPSTHHTQQSVGLPSAFHHRLLRQPSSKDKTVACTTRVLAGRQPSRRDTVAQLLQQSDNISRSLINNPSPVEPTPMHRVPPTAGPRMPRGTMTPCRGKVRHLSACMRSFL